MTYAIISYNNFIHSVTGFTPFQIIIKGHINNDNPFELTDEKIVSNYVQKHKEWVKCLYDLVKTKIETNKKNIKRLNQNRDDPSTFSEKEKPYVNNKERNKAKSKFSESKIISETEQKLVTNQGTYHKSAVKKPRKQYQ